MARRIFSMLAALYLGFQAMSASAQATPETSREATPGFDIAGAYECDDLDDYFDAWRAALPDDDAQRRLVSEVFWEDTEYTDFRPSEMRIASEGFDTWAANLEAISDDEVPFAARRYHVAFIDVAGVAASTLNAWANGGPFAAMAYVEAMEEAGVVLTDAKKYGHNACGELWDREFGK